MSAHTPTQIWWTANELAEAGLPDMPHTRQSVERWIKRVNQHAKVTHLGGL